MYLEETSKIRKRKSEEELIKIAEKIGDKIIFNDYEEEQVLTLVKTLLELDFLSMKYETREQILSVLCDSVSNYEISSKIDWYNIFKVKDKLEDDLKEYAEEFLHN